MSDGLVKRLRDWENVYPEDYKKPPGHLYEKAADRIEELEAEIETLTTAGIVEVAARNPNVLEYMKHWEGRAEAAEAENKRWRELADWYDATMEKHVTQTGKPARISDESGVWHDGPAADMAQKILRGLQDLFRATLKGAE